MRPSAARSCENCALSAPSLSSAALSPPRSAPIASSSAGTASATFSASASTRRRACWARRGSAASGCTSAASLNCASRSKPADCDFAGDLPIDGTWPPRSSYPSGPVRCPRCCPSLSGSSPSSSRSSISSAGSCAGSRCSPASTTTRCGPRRTSGSRPRRARAAAIELEAALVARGLDARERLPENCFLAVNVGPDALLSDAVGGVLAGRDLSRLVVEVTEAAPVKDYEAMVRALGVLRDQGAWIAVDDAGAGYASLNHVIRLRPDFVKLDRALVMDVDRDPAKYALVETFGVLAGPPGCVAAGRGHRARRRARGARGDGRSARPGLRARPTGSGARRHDADPRRAGRVGRALGPDRRRRPRRASHVVRRRAQPPRRGRGRRAREPLAAVRASSPTSPPRSPSAG